MKMIARNRPLPSVVTTLLLVPLMVPGSPTFPFVRLLTSVPGTKGRVVEERNSLAVLFAPSSVSSKALPPIGASEVMFTGSRERAHRRV